MKIPINKLASLANIALDPKEEEALSKELEKVLGYVEKINSIKDLDKIPPTSHPFDSEDVYREDKVVEKDTAKDVLKYAPSIEGSFFKVPRVIENSG